MQATPSLSLVTFRHYSQAFFLLPYSLSSYVYATQFGVDRNVQSAPSIPPLSPDIGAASEDAAAGFKIIFHFLKLEFAKDRNKGTWSIFMRKNIVLLLVIPTPNSPLSFPLLLHHSPPIPVSLSKNGISA